MHSQEVTCRLTNAACMDTAKPDSLLTWASKESPRHFSPAVEALWMGTCVAGIKWSCRCGIIQNDPEIIHWHSAYIPIA